MRSLSFCLPMLVATIVGLGCTAQVHARPAAAQPYPPPRPGPAAYGPAHHAGPPVAQHANPQGPAKHGWVFLGDRKVNFRGDKDTIAVTGNKGRFRAIRLHVSGSAMEMFRVRVTFGNGQVYSPNVRLRFERGTWTRRIDLPGKQRVIRKVEFWYRSLAPKSGKAHVKLYGQH